MSLSYPIPRGTRDVSFIAAGGQTQFGPIEFICWDPLDIRVLEKPVGAQFTAIVDPADYTITPASPALALPATFMVTFNEGRALNSFIRVMGRRIPARASDVTRNGALKSQALEAELDQQVATMQELRRDMDEWTEPVIDFEAAAAIVEAAADHVDDVFDDIEAERILVEAARDVVLAAGTGNNMATRAVAAAATIPALTKYVIVGAYQTPGDLGGATYARVATQPTHAAKFRSADRFLPDGSTDAGNGGWWEIKTDTLRPEHLGSIGDGVTDDTAAFTTALDVAIALDVALTLTDKKTYLLNTWPSAGYYPAGPVRLRGIARSSVLKGPAGTSYFLRPGTAFDISGVKFDRWTGVVRRDTAETGTITGARFFDNECTNISGIPINIEIPFKEGHISKNTFANCSGGYVIRIGENTYANQDTWSDNFIQDNIFRTITATGSTSLFAILAHGKDTLISGNRMNGLTSTNGEAIGIYVKLRDSQIINNTIRNVTSTGGSGAALDVAGISLKGAPRNITISGVQGYKNICTGNQIRNIGAQAVKGSGIRCQISDSIVAKNQVQDVGLIGISSDDSNGSSFNKIEGNSIEGYNMLGTTGIELTTYGVSHKIAGNTIKDFLNGISIGCGSNSLASTLVEGNSITTTRASSRAFLFAASGGNITGVMIGGGNDVELPATGTIIQNNATVTGVNVRNNDFSRAIAAGAALNGGSTSGITSAANP